jgi:hypothetical protein
MDLEIRNILIKYKIHYRPGCLERLYMSRKVLGRGLVNISNKSATMMLNMYNRYEISGKTKSTAEVILSWKSKIVSI